MYCNKCGNELPDGSVFCNKCGSKVYIQYSIERNSFIKKIAINKTYNVITIIILIVFSIVSYNLIEKNIYNINNTKELMKITQNIIDLKDENPLLLGSSYSEEKELKQYQFQLYGHYAIIAAGLIVIASSVFIITYMVSYLFKALKEWRL